MIHIVRHGETEANRQGLIQGQRHGSRLTEVGIEQAHNMGQYLRDQVGAHDTTIYTSDLDRAISTAKIIRYYVAGDDIVEAKALRERDLGHWEGKSWSDIYGTMEYQLYKDDKTYWKGHGGESYYDVWDRIRDWNALMTDPNAIIVSHQTAIAVLCNVDTPSDGFSVPKINHNEVVTIQDHIMWDWQVTRAF